MTTTVTTASSGTLTANGVTPIPFLFQAISADEIQVTRNNVVVSPTTYTVALNDDGTGAITPLFSWGSDEVVISSAPDYQQRTRFERHGAWYPDQFNAPLDRLARTMLSLRDTVERGVAIPQSGEEVDGADTNLAISPMTYGAVGNGIADDTAAIINAINACITTGRPLDGGNKVYAVQGDIPIAGVDGFMIKCLRLKQTSTVASTTRRTVHVTGCNRLRIDYLEIDKGVQGTHGALSDAAGFWIDGGTGHRFGGMRVFGAGRGAGVAFHNISNSYLAGLHAHNLTYDNVAAVDDQINAIWINNCTDCVVVGPRSHNHTGNGVGTGSINTRYTRGISIGGCTRVTIANPSVSYVDQGLDLSGSVGNIDCVVLGGTTKNCSIYGVKLANSAYYCKVIGHISTGSGVAGFLASGPGSALSVETEGCEFIGCSAYDTGAVAVGIGSPTGFLIYRGYEITEPKGIRFTDCRAIDRQATKTMLYGYRSDVVYDGSSGMFNEVVNCTTRGATVAAENGLQRIYAHVTSNGPQSIPNATLTAANFATEVEDSLSLHSTSSNTNQVNVPVAGTYRIRVHLEFSANATGYRTAQISKSGGLVGGKRIVNAVNGANTSIDFEEMQPAIVGNYFDVRVEQTSGGALNLDLSASWMIVELIKEA